MPLTGPLTLAGLVSAIALLVGTGIAMRLRRERLGGLLAAIAIGLTAVSTIQTQPRPFANQPYPDAPEVADVTWRMTHGQGYTTALHTTQPLPPRYAPGFPLALAPFSIVGGQYPASIELGAAFYAGLYVVAVGTAAWSMGGPVAGAVASLIVGTSPFARDMATMIMSDAFAASLTVMLIPLVRSPTATNSTIAGTLAGSLVAVRLPMVLNLPALLAALPRRRWPHAIAAAAIPLVAYGLFNKLVYGGPLTTGYDLWVKGFINFDLRYPLHHLLEEGPWITPDALNGELIQLISGKGPEYWPIGGPQRGLSNILLYSALLCGLFWVFTPPFVSLLGFLGCLRTPSRPESRFTLVLCAFSLGFFCIYFHQGTRFMAAPASLLLIAASARFAYWTGTLPTLGRQAQVQETSAASANARASTTPPGRPVFAKVLFAKQADVQRVDAPATRSSH